MEDMRPAKRAKQACEPCRLVNMPQILSWSIILTSISVGRSRNVPGRGLHAHTASDLASPVSMIQGRIFKDNALARTVLWFVTSSTLCHQVRSANTNNFDLKEVRMESLEEKLDFVLERLEYATEIQ